MTQRPKFVWAFDSNRRVYREGQPGPVWRAHWRKIRIVGETRVSWILEVSVFIFGRDVNRVPKGDLGKYRKYFAFSETELDALEFVETHRYKIADAVRYVDSPEILRQVAELVGYKA